MNAISIRCLFKLIIYQINNNVEIIFKLSLKKQNILWSTNLQHLLLLRKQQKCITYNKQIIV